MFDGDREAQPTGYGADPLDRGLARRLIKPQPGFVAYPTMLVVYKD